jgi:hypothetical protein
MSYTAVENTPIIVNLPQVAINTGWTIVGDTAVHESCNSGEIQLTGYTPISGHTYELSYKVKSISGGNVQLRIGTTSGAVRTTTGNYTETLLASGTNPIISFYSNANCEIQAFNIRDTAIDVNPFQKHTIVYSPVINKWTSYYTMAPDIGFSMYIRTLVCQYGVWYSQLNGSANRNTLFGTNYDSIFKFVENKNTTVVNSYQSLSIQSNQLMITTDDGVETSLGQLSALIDTDFEQQILTDGNLQVDIYDRYGVYMASFVNDSNDEDLKGSYLIVQLQSTDSQNPMQVYTVEIESAIQKIGAR